MDDSCIICLDEKQTETNPLQNISEQYIGCSCKAFIHQNCLKEQLKFNFHCPICKHIHKDHQNSFNVLVIIDNNHNRNIHNNNANSSGRHCTCSIPFLISINYMILEIFFCIYITVTQFDEPASISNVFLAFTALFLVTTCLQTAQLYCGLSGCLLISISLKSAGETALFIIMAACLHKNIWVGVFSVVASILCTLLLLFHPPISQQT